MQIGLSLSLTGLGGGPGSPQQFLGSSLLGFWDADRADKFTLSGAAVITWTDLIGGYAVTQGVGGSRPLYAATSFNGRPGVTFDGADDELTLTTSPFPTGASPCEIWLLSDQAALVADTGVRTAVSYGSAAIARRCIFRVVSGGANRARAGTGDGATMASSENSTVDFSGRHVSRSTISATTTTEYVDAVVGTPAAAVPATDSTRFRMGALSDAVATLFWSGTHNAVLITSPLTTIQAAQLTNYLKARGGIA